MHQNYQTITMDRCLHFKNTILIMYLQSLVVAIRMDVHPQYGEEQQHNINKMLAQVKKTRSEFP